MVRDSVPSPLGGRHAHFVDSLCDIMCQQQQISTGKLIPSELVGNQLHSRSDRLIDKISQIHPKKKRTENTMLKSPSSIAAALSTLIASPILAEGELNLYSSRHYDTDERLYSEFEEATGITINRIEGKADELIARMQAEGANSPADVLLTVDTSRLARAKNAGILQAIDSPILEERIPANLQDQDN